MTAEKIAIIGGGRLGNTLAAALRRADKDVAAVTRSGDDNIAATDGVMAVFLAVPDGKIAPVAAELAAAFSHRDKDRRPKIVAHVSGATTLEPLQPLAEAGVHIGSIHPLQSFTPASKDDENIFVGVYAALAGDEFAVAYLRELAGLLGAVPFTVPDDEISRAQYHAAACIACNYLVTLTAMAQELFRPWVDEPGAALAALLPLQKNTLANLARVPEAMDALTGPIARGDMATVERHKRALPPEMLPVYEALCEATIRIKNQKRG